MAWFSKFIGKQPAPFDMEDEFADDFFETAIENETSSLPSETLAVARVQAIVGHELRRLTTERHILETEIRTRLEKLRQTNTSIAALQPAHDALVADTQKGDTDRVPQVTPLAIGEVA